ncbi:MAG: beta-1,6-N-acetylglucosaminyltransferase, partial [Elusimicrobiota bacterium]|nr:beta-1,6-N-acetylglucosaminyltransferase [Elusimicrobiota bacterium]
MLTTYHNKSQIERLINHLSKDFDIYIHIDKKSKLEIQERNNVFVYKKYKSYWGSFNQIMAILFLFEQSYKRGYDRYLLISDNDLPLKTNQQIKDFFIDNDNEYFTSVKLPCLDWDRGVLYRVLEYWPAVKKKDRRPLTWKIARFFFKLCGKRPLDYEFYGGADWFNFTHNCLDKMFTYLKENPKYIQRFRWTYVASEIFFQTLFHLSV